MSTFGAIYTNDAQNIAHFKIKKNRFSKKKKGIEIWALAQIKLIFQETRLLREKIFVSSYYAQTTRINRSSSRVRLGL